MIITPSHCPSVKERWSVFGVASNGHLMSSAIRVALYSGFNYTMQLMEREKKTYFPHTQQEKKKNTGKVLDLISTIALGFDAKVWPGRIKNLVYILPKDKTTKKPESAPLGSSRHHHTVSIRTKPNRLSRLALLSKYGIFWGKTDGS